jgi:hypothetical protein
MGKLIIMENLRASLAKKYPGGLVPRKKIDEATGCILHSRTLANLDSLGTGIKNPVRIGRRIFYQSENLLKYIEDRMVFDDCEKGGATL